MSFVLRPNGREGPAGQAGPKSNSWASSARQLAEGLSALFQLLKTLFYIRYRASHWLEAVPLRLCYTCLNPVSSLPSCGASALLLHCVQSLVGKYLEPPKSLQEAARRAWSPVGATRSLQFDRRQLKAAAVAVLQQHQLMHWFDNVVHPQGGRHHALCVQVWGGKVGVEEAYESAAAQQPTACVDGSKMEAFKACQPLLPLPEVQLPPAVHQLSQL